MRCVYCGNETDNLNGICASCNQDKSLNDMEDIFSSTCGTPDTMHKKTENKIQDIVFKVMPKTAEILPRYAPPRVIHKIKRSKYTPFVTVAVAIAVIVILCFALGIIKTPTRKIETHLTKGDYASAITVYDKKFEKGNSKRLNGMLEERLELQLTEYAAGNIRWEAAKQELDTIEKMSDKSFKKEFKAYDTKFDKMKLSKDSYELGVKSKNKGNLVVAIDSFRKVQKTDCNYSAAKAKLKLCVMEYKNNALSAASEYVFEGNYKKAVKTLKTALETLKEDSLIEKRIAEYENSSAKKSRTSVLNEVDLLADREDYSGAIKVIEDAMKANSTLKKDPVLKKNITYYTERFAEQFEEKIEDYISRKDYTKAGILLLRAEELIPNNQVFLDKKAALTGKVPIYLDTLEAYSKTDWKVNRGKAKDSYGVDRSDEQNYFVLKSTSTATYYVGGNYTTLIANFAAAKAMDENVNCKVRITAKKADDDDDDEKADEEYNFKECEINAKTNDEQIEFDIEDCTEITFTVSGEGAAVIMYNVLLAVG